MTTAAFKVSITTGAAGGQTKVHYRVAFKQQAAHSLIVNKTGRYFDTATKRISAESLDHSSECCFCITNDYRDVAMHKCNYWRDVTRLKIAGSCTLLVSLYLIGENLPIALQCSFNLIITNKSD